MAASVMVLSVKILPHSPNGWFFRDQQGKAFKEGGNQLERHTGLGLILRDVGDIVEDQQLVSDKFLIRSHLERRVPLGVVLPQRIKDFAHVRLRVYPDSTFPPAPRTIIAAVRPYFSCFVATRRSRGPLVGR